MGTPTTVTIFGNTATVQKVQIQGHRSIASQEENGETTSTDYYVVTWNNPADVYVTRGCTDGTTTVPVRGQVHPEDSSLYAKRVQIDPIDNDTRQQFQARIDYSDAQEGITNPLEQPREIEWDISDGNQEAYFKDNDPAGPKAVVTTAGELFSDFLQRYSGAISATFKVNIGPTAFNVSEAINYSTPQPAVNSDGFTFDGYSITAGQALFRGVQCSAVQTLNGVKYRVLTIKLDFKESWSQVVDSRGFNEAMTIDGHSVLREIVKGVPPVKPERPWPLDATGAAKPNITDTPWPLTFYPYPQLPFAVWSFS